MGSRVSRVWEGMGDVPPMAPLLGKKPLSSCSDSPGSANDPRTDTSLCSFLASGK